MDLDEAMREAEEDQIVEACLALGIESARGAAVLAWHRQAPELLGLFLEDGGNVPEYVGGIDDLLATGKLKA